MTLHEYKLVGSVCRYRNGHGKRAKHYAQKFWILSDPPRKVRSVSLATIDKQEARNRAAVYVKTKVHQLAMSFDPHFRTGHNDIAAALEEYSDTQLAMGNTDKQVALVKTRISAVIAEAGFREHRELDGVRVVRAIRALLDRKRFNTVATANKYVEAMRAWTRWMMLNDRLDRDPLATVQKLRGDTTNTRPRAILSQEGFEKLLRVTKDQPARRNLTGQQRYWLYLIASQTGLRAHELNSLSPASFHLDEQPPFVEIRNTISKRGKKTGKRDQVLLQRGFADVLGPWLETMPSNERLWHQSRSWWYKAAHMLRMDMEAAGIPDLVETRAGVAVVDFHSFRGLQVTNAIRTGRPSQVVMKLARLSSEQLLKRYAKISETEVTDCVEAMPLPKLDHSSSNPRR